MHVEIGVYVLILKIISVDIIAVAFKAIRATLTSPEDAKVLTTLFLFFSLVITKAWRFPRVPIINNNQ